MSFDLIYNSPDEEQNTASKSNSVYGKNYSKGTKRHRCGARCRSGAAAVVSCVIQKRTENTTTRAAQNTYQQQRTKNTAQKHEQKTPQKEGLKRETIVIALFGQKHQRLSAAQPAREPRWWCRLAHLFVTLRQESCG